MRISRAGGRKANDHRGKVVGFPRRLARLVALLASLIFLQIVAAGVAFATDWVVNVDDDGYDPTPVNGTVVYRITVSNDDLASNTAPANTVILTLPGNGTFTGGTGNITNCQPVPKVGPGTVICDVPPLPGLAEVTLFASVKATATPLLTITAEVPGLGRDTDLANNKESQSTTIVSSADMQLTVAGPATQAAGAVASYAFTATNLGPDAVTNAKVTVPAPVGLVDVSFPGCTLVGTDYQCAIPGPLAVNASRTFTLSGAISVASTSTVTLQGSVGGGTPVDPNPNNNLVTVSTSVTAGSDVRIAKSRSPAIVKVGDQVTFTLAASYVGDSPNGLEILDTIPITYDRDPARVKVTSPAEWACSYINPTVKCTRASGNGPGNVSLGSISIETTAISTGGVNDSRNTATISSQGPFDPNLANNTASDGGAVIENPTSDLKANKSGPAPPLVVVGQPYQFSISTTNLGNRPFSGTLTMTENLPSRLELISVVFNGWSCAPSPPVTGPATIICTRVYEPSAPLAVGATTPPVDLTALVGPGSGAINNCMTVSSSGAAYPDPNDDNDTACYDVSPSTPSNAADISVSKTRTLASLPAGEVQTYSIEVINSGPSESSAISVADSLTNLINSNVGPTGAGLVSLTTVPGLATGLSCSTAPSGGTSRQLSCTIGTLPVCTAGSNCPLITVDVRPGGSAGTRSNTASVISNTVADPNLANNTSTVSYDITARADVEVAKTANESSPAGQNLIYVVTARTVNDGRSAAENVTIEDTLPDQVLFLSAVPSTGSCPVVPTPNTFTGSGNNTVRCNLGTIANGAQQTVTITVRPKSSARGQTLTNNVTVSTTTAGDVPGNNSASASTSISNPSLDLLVNKTDTPDPTAVGENTVYTLTVTNTGPSAAENVRIVDKLPGVPNTPTNLLAFSSVEWPAGGSCGTVPTFDSTGGTLECSVPYLPAGQSRTVTVTMQGIARGVTVNTVIVSSDETDAGFDTNMTNNSRNENTTVRTRVDVELVSKIPSKTPVTLREEFSFAVKVRNNTGGNFAEADNVKVTDNLPANMVLTGTPVASVTVGTTTENSCAGGAGATSFICDFGTMSNGGELIITMPVKIIAVSALPQSFTNTATVSTTSLENNTSNNSNSGQVTVEQAASLAGTVFRDFNDNGLQDAPGDTPISGVVVTLQGNTIDGASVTRQVTTLTDGSYLFTLLPAGVYSVTRGDVSEPGLRNGKVTPGTAGGIPAAVSVSDILLTAVTAATGYDFALVPIPGIAVGKALTAGPTVNSDGTFDVTFRVTVSVSSLENIVNITVNDQLAGPAPLFGSFAPVLSAPGTYNISAAPSGTCGGLNAGFDGSGVPALASGFSLPPSGSCYIDFSLRVLAAVPLPPLQNGGRYFNKATASGTGELSGQTPSGTSPLVPVDVLIPQLVLAKSLTGNSDPDATGTVTLGDVLTYTLTATNSGSVTLSNVVVSDDKISPGTVTCPSVAPGETCVLTGALTITLADVQAGKVVNTGTADSDQTTPVTATVTTPVIPLIDKNTITKVTPVTVAKRGERIPYVITVRDSPLNPARIVDIMPPGFSYVPNSAVANGVKMEPVIDGRRLTFDGLVPDAEGTIVLKLTLVANASVKPGDAINQAQLVNPNTGEVVATARARVRILEEAVFDCSDIIGKVFDDRNRDGYQDEGEPGLPGVRMATVNGLLVTSDEYGRFNIACADIPDQDRGSNFILKLDTRTLPSGYHVTSENPRRVRLTAGKIVKLNFAAAGLRLVRLDLNGKVFEEGSAALKPKWRQGLERLIAALEAEPSALMVIYQGESGKLAKARLKSVRAAVEKLWTADPGRYRLEIETRIVSSGGVP